MRRDTDAADARCGVVKRLPDGEAAELRAQMERVRRDADAQQEEQLREIEELQVRTKRETSDPPWNGLGFHSLNRPQACLRIVPHSIGRHLHSSLVWLRCSTSRRQS